MQHEPGTPWADSSRSSFDRAAGIGFGLVVVALITSVFLATRNSAFPVGVDDPTAERMLRTASAACAVRITGFEDIDERPSDGDHWRKVTFDVIAGSGEVPEFLYLVIAFGGHRPPGAAPERPRRLQYGSLQIGERHWFVFGAAGDGGDLPPGMIGWWRWDAADLPSQVVDAVVNDRFAAHPVYDPASGLVHEWTWDERDDRVTIRVRDESSVVWQTSLSGRPDSRRDTLTTYHAKPTNELEWPTDREFAGLFTQLVVTLPERNLYGVPGGDYQIHHMLDLRKGSVLGTWVAARQMAWDLRAFRQYHTERGDLILALDFETLETGGLAVGADSESWRRKTERRFDPMDGSLLSTRTYRFGVPSASEGEYREPGWILVPGT